MAGDVTASAEIAEAFLPELVARVKRAIPEVRHPHDWETAAHEALISYFGHPERFDSDKLPLPAYLFMSAKRDLLNLLHPNKIDRNTQSFIDLVALGNTGSEQESGELELPAGPDRTETSDPYFWEKVRALVPDPHEQQFVGLMMAGIRDTAAYAAVLGVAHLEPGQQEREVKRVKDRLKKRLRRDPELVEYRDE